MSARLAPLAIALVACGSGVLAAEGPAHHADRGFRNPFSDTVNGGVGNFLRMARMRFFSDAWPAYDPDRDRVPRATPVPASGASANATVTWVGHATVLIQHQGINVLTDPMFSDRASPLSFAGPKRVTRPALALAELPRVDVVVISHNHYDHLDAATVEALGSGPVYYVPLGLRGWFERRGVDPGRVVEMDWWDRRDHAPGQHSLSVTATPSQHFSGRSLTDRNETLWASWSLAWDDFQVWFGGDTGYNDRQFREIGERLGEIDLGIIPIGAYEPRFFMRAVHVNPEEAVRIHQDIGAAASLAIHWGAFILSAEGVLTPPRALAAARAAAGVAESEFAAFAVGETRRYPTGRR